MDKTVQLKPSELYAVTFILAFCSLSYELLIANTLSVITGYKILWQSLTIGLYLLLLGIGAFYSEKTQKGNEYAGLITVEIKLAIWASLFVLAAKLIFSFTYLLNKELSLSFVDQGYYFILPALLCSVFTLVIGFYSGFEIPLLIRAAEHASVNHPENRILACNYLGSLAGALAVSLILFPKLDALYSMIVVSGLNMSVTFYLFLKRTVKVKPAYVAACLFFISVSLAVGLNRSSIDQFYLKSYYLYGNYKNHVTGSFLSFMKQKEGLPPVKRIRSLYQYIDIIDYRFFTGGGRMLALNENYQFDTEEEKLYHEAFAHLPMMVFDKIPKKVLVLGAGDGLLIRELIRHESIDEILHVELDGTMYDLAVNDPWLMSMNRNSLMDSRVTTIIKDAFRFVRTATGKFDAVFIDFPYPYSFSTLRLYSYEFYDNVRRLLKKDAFLVINCPVTQDYDLEGGDDPYRKFNNMLFNTFIAAGMKTLFPYEHEEHTFLAAAREDIPVNIQNSYNFPVHLDTFDESSFEDLSEQNFPYTINRKYINSIFKPYIIYTPKYEY